MKNQKGFSVIEGLLILILVGIIGGAGWLVYDSKKKTEVSLNNAANTSISTSKNVKKLPENKAEENKLNLASNSVEFILPNKWLYDKGKSCYMSIYMKAKTTCIEGASVTPGENLPTRYGDGTEFFKIYFNVFNNPKGSNAKTWLQLDYMGAATVDDNIDGKVSSTSSPINGYDTYFLKTSYKGDGTTIDEIYYSLAKGEKVILIYARIYEPGKTNAGINVGDFRKFEPHIADVANSTKIK